MRRWAWPMDGLCFCRLFARCHPHRLSPPTGIKGIIFDKDNTLTAPYIDSVHPQVAAAFENSKRVFGAKKLIIISNSAGTLDDANYEAATRIEAKLGKFLNQMTVTPTA